MHKPSSSTRSGEVQHLLRTVLESVKNLQLAEKMDWINRGTFQLIFQFFLKNGSDENDFDKIPIKIAKHLLKSNLEGCKIYVKRCVAALDCDAEWECVGIYRSIYELFKNSTFCEVPALSSSLLSPLSLFLPFLLYFPLPPSLSLSLSPSLVSHH